MAAETKPSTGQPNDKPKVDKAVIDMKIAEKEKLLADKTTIKK